MNGNITALAPKILIAEDNINFSNSLYESLKNLSAEIQVVTDGKKALTIIKEYKPSILLLDLKMPGLNGIELLSQIRGINIKVIIISGETNLLNSISMKSYDIISCVLIKPVDIKKVYNSVNYLLLEQKYSKTLAQLKTVLDKFEFNKSSNGYVYLLECLTEILKNPQKLNNIKSSVYTVVSAKHGLDKIDRVKWCIIKSLKSMCRYTDKNILLKHFVDDTKITPKNFMLEIYNIIKNKEF